MKTARDPRHLGRQEVIKNLFAQSFIPQKINNPKTGMILENLETVDNYITQIAPEFPIDKLNRVDLAILRLAVYEIMIEKKEPNKVVVDEAIELAKEMGGDASPAFINGALGKLLKDFVKEQS